jgi:hypothetical protein
MLEVLFDKARKSMAGDGFKHFRWMRVLPPGVWIILAVVGFVGGRLLQVRASRPAHREEIAAAYGSVNMFFGYPEMNHNGSQFIYAATDAKGYALLLCDTSTGHKQIVCEESAFNGMGRNFDLRPWPWSPDDSSFIYTTHSNLVICPIDTNKAPVTLDIGTTRASSVIWVNPSEFAWLEGETICYAKEQEDGQWDIRRIRHQGQVLSLTAVDDHTIAWLQDDFICRLDLTKDLTGTNNPFGALNQEVFVAPLTNHLLLWLDASTLQQTNQASVKNLPDLSRKSNNLVYVRNAPTYNGSNSPGALNRKGTIHFESGSARIPASGLRTAARLGLAGPHPRSIFAVMRRDGSRNAVMLINTGNTGVSGGYFGLCDQNDFLYLPSGSFPGRNDGKLTKLPSSWHILETVYDGTNCKAYVNSGLRGELTLPFKTVDSQVEIGLRTINQGSTNTRASDGDFAELLIYDQALSFAEKRQVEDYLGAKWFRSRPLSPDRSFVWIDPEMTGLTGFTYSKETGRFLINRTENSRDSLWRLDAGTGAVSNASQIFQGRFLSAVQWAGTNQFAYASRENGHSGLVLADLSGAEKDRLFERGNIPWFRVTPDQKQALFWGNVSNEVSAGIWQYSLASKQLRPIAPGSDYSSPHAKDFNPFRGSIKLPSGRSVDCIICPPGNFDRRKKYPLVLGDTVLAEPLYNNEGRLWMPGIATCGAYVVIINRATWLGGVEQWGQNVMGVYQSLARDPCIDTGRVYLFAISVETKYMSDFMAKSPGPWKGAILLNPTTLPDFSQSPPFQPRPKILISSGSEEHQEARLKKYQADALNYGGVVEYIIHPGENHTLVGNAAQLARTQAIMRFIFEE